MSGIHNHRRAVSPDPAETKACHLAGRGFDTEAASPGCFGHFADTKGGVEESSTSV